jgi:hypothetical protein
MPALGGGGYGPPNARAARTGQRHRDGRCGSYRRSYGGRTRARDRSSRPCRHRLSIHEFTRSGLLSSQGRFHGHHVLRTRGFICIPVELEEIQGYLATAEPDPDTGLLMENAELRAIRENLQRLRSTTIVQQPAETVYLDRLRITGFLAIRNVWADRLVPIPTARARTEWLWRSLMLTPIDWAHTIVDPAGVVTPLTGSLNVISNLLLTIPNNDLERARAVRDWIDADVLAPLERVSSETLDELTRMTITRLRGLINDCAATH